MARRMRKRSVFSLTHYKLASLSMGDLVPISCMEVLPGDTFQHSTSVFLRVAPMVTPVMHPVHVKIWHFFVPNRLLWENWEDFRTGGEDGTDVSEFPTINAPAGGFAVGSLADYFGIPPEVDGISVSALPFRAYTLIYNEWFRNQDTTDPYPLSLADGVDTTTNQVMLPSPWGKDYFTTASTQPQRGPQVTIPVTGQNVNTTLPVAGRLSSDPSMPMAPTFGGDLLATPKPIVFGTYSQNGAGPNGASWIATQVAPMQVILDGTDPSAKPQRHLRWGDPGLEAHFNQFVNLGSINISDWREAMALQRFQEQRELYGSRYTEYLRTLGIRASDARLQRPEYLGGGRQTIQFSEVLQTAEGTDPVGTLRGHGVGSMRTNRYRKFFEEDGLIMSFCSVRPIGVYMQGLPRMWSRRTREEYWTPQFEHLSQQPVYTRELYAGVTDKETVFGYQNIYDEYRSHPSSVSGEMRNILNTWHMARDFANVPVLNNDFITSPPTNRIFAAQDNDTLYAMFYHKVRARRLMSKSGNPR